MPTKKLPRWDLSDLYAGITDPKIQKDLEKLERRAVAFERRYNHRLGPTVAVATVARPLQEYAALLQGVRKLESYAHLEFSTNTTSPSYGSFFQHIATQATNIVSRLLFFEVKLSSLPQAKLRSFIRNAKLQPFRHFLTKQMRHRPHRLPSETEEILMKKSLTGSQAFVRLYEQTATSQAYYIKRAKRKQRVSMAQLLTLSRSPRRSDRRAAARARHEAHKHDQLNNTFTYNTLIQDWGLETQLRHFELPEDVRHHENETSRAAVDALVEAVVKSYPLVHEYYRFKQQLLGLPKLYDFDKYAPLVKTQKKYSFRQAQEIVLAAFEEFSPQFAAAAAIFFAKRWIDAPPHRTKQSGAMCMYVTPNTHPYVLLNYQGTLDDITTLAHELGHGVNAYLARGQNMLHYDWPLTIAETASVFGEMLLFNFLKKRLDTPQETLALYLAKIEGIFATVHRQISMFRFERRAHSHRAHSGELSATHLDAIWIEELGTMFGNSLVLTEYEKSYWQTIPHLFRSPFYVYSYAFGELLTLSLFALYENQPKRFATKYLDLLRSGGSKSPQELLAPFNVNLADEKFWQGGIAEIQKIVKEAKKIARQTQR